MNSELLLKIRHLTDRVPFMLDRVPASTDPESGPFLITSSRGLVWVEKAFSGGFLRVATRNCNSNDLYAEMVTAIAEEGLLRDWGNVLPATLEGISEAVSRFQYYELPNIVLIHSKDFDTGLCENLDLVLADWVPEGWAVMVPDREYVGTLFEVGKEHFGAISHNASRGVVIIR